MNRFIVYRHTRIGLRSYLYPANVLQCTAKLSSRSFSSNQKNADQVIDPEAAQKAREEMEKTVLPWMVSPLVSPNSQEIYPLGRGKNTEAILAHIPEEQLKRRVRIYKAAKTNMQSGSHKTHCWNIELENQKRWVNPLMGYQSGSDPLGVTGVRNIKFDTLEEAESFCERHGWAYQVDRVIPKPDFCGKKGYQQNFLNYHVATRRSKMPPGKFAKYQFSHPERGKSAWVNLKHTDFGATESQAVSKTHWRDEDHQNVHSAENWRYDSLEKKAELARRLGK